MRMLRWMSEHTINDKFLNDYIQEKMSITHIIEKIIEIRLRWLCIYKEKKTARGLNEKS